MVRRSSGWWWILLSLVFQILGLALGKAAALRMRTFTLAELARNGLYFASLACLALQALAWPQALRRFPLLPAYLLMSGYFVAIPVVSAVCFHEPISGRNILGSLVIMAGIGLVLAGKGDLARD